MKKGWEVFKLKNLSEIMYGYTSKSSERIIGPKYLRITDIQNKTVDWEVVPNCSISENDYEKYKLEKNDIVFARTGATTGKSYLVKDNPKSVFASYLIRVKIKENIVSDYLYYFFQSKNYWINIEIGISGSAQGGFSAKKLGNLKIPLPPLDEQKAIVSKLDQIFKAIDQAKANLEQNIANAEDLFQSQLDQIFSQTGKGWEEKKLGEVLKLKSGKNLTKKKMNNDGDYSVYGGNGFAGNHDDYTMDGEYVIIGRVGAQCGNVRYISGKFWLTDNAFCVDKMNIDFNLKFLSILLSNINLRSYARQTAQPVISNSSIKNAIISYPKEKNEQLRIVKLYEKSLKVKNSLKQKYQQKLESLEELKQSVLEKAFLGELV